MLCRSAMEIDSLLSYLTDRVDRPEDQLLREDKGGKLDMNKLIELGKLCSSLVNQKKYYS